jgi:hypothetical protein
MADEFPAYPEVLTYENWDRKKATLTPETGIGKELKALKATCAKIPVVKIKVLKMAAGVEEVQKALQEVKGYWPTITTARDALLGFSRLASKKAAEAKKSKTFPSKSRELIEAMADAALNYATAIRDTPDRWLKEAQKRAEAYAGLRDKKFKLIDETHVKMENHRKAAEKVNKQLEDRVSEASDLAQAGQINPAKLKIKAAADLLAALTDLLKKCEADSKVWRTDKTVALSREDSLVATEKSNAIMNNNKAVKKFKEDAEKVLKDLVKTLGAKRG